MRRNTTHIRSYQIPQIASGTTMVTVTAGGNDVGFASTMLTCRTWTAAACDSAINSSVSKIDNLLPGRMDSMFAVLAAKLPSTATVYVLGYPRLYTEASSCGSFAISGDYRHRLNNVANWLSSQLSQATAKADSRYPERFRYLDVRPRFADHSLCSSDSWMLGPLWSPSDPSVATRSYHPNERGQRYGYYATLRAVTG